MYRPKTREQFKSFDKKFNFMGPTMNNLFGSQPLGKTLRQNRNVINVIQTETHATAPVTAKQSDLSMYQSPKKPMVVF